jgi:uncharacterized protein (DUF1330 family)
MTAYIILQTKIVDEEQHAKYREGVMPLIEKFGGRHIVKGGPLVVLEGSHDGRRFSIIEFPSIDIINTFWTSPEYTHLKELRKDTALFDVWMLPGSE